MKRIGFAVLAATLVFAIGCSSPPPVVKEGDKLTVTQTIDRARFDASYGESVRAVTHTNGAIVEVPAGTVFEVFTTPRNEAKTVEVVPIKVGDVTDANEILEMFVQERYRTHDFLYYTFSFDIGMVGQQLKKVD